MISVAVFAVSYFYHQALWKHKLVQSTRMVLITDSFGVLESLVRGKRLHRGYRSYSLSHF